MSETLVRRGKTTDDVLLELSVSGLSPQQISERLRGAISAERVRVRIAAILESPDWLTDAQQERAMLRLVHVNLLELRESIADSDKGDFLDNMKVQLAYIDRIFERYNRRAAATEEDLNTYNQNVGRHLGMVVDGVLAFLRGALRDQLTPDQWETLIAEAMDYARGQIEAKQITPAP